MSKPAFSVLIGVAVCGLVLSLIVHLCALARIGNPFGAAAWGLHAGIFVVWFPTVFAARRLSRDGKGKDLWRLAWNGCPTWMRWMTFAFFAYALVNFGLAFGGGSNPDPDEFQSLRGFSGHWMLFYSMAAAMLYACRNATFTNASCINGHRSSALGTPCEICGQPISKAQP
jgi:hypothetical protein